MVKKATIVLVILIILFVVFRVFIVDGNSASDAEYKAHFYSKNAYVGEESCKKCHSAEHKEWKQSDHYMSMLPANDSTVVGDFNNVTFTADGVTSRFYKKGNKFYINTEGDDGKNHDFEVKYIFGYKPLQQYLVYFPGGRMQVPRLSWDVNKKKWYNQYAGQNIAAHDWLHWTGNAQNWNTMCASCHSTNLHKNYDTKTDTYKTSYSVINVSCESCHGPGLNHSKYLTSEEYKAGEKTVGSYLKMHKKSSQLEIINDCAPCHARVSELTAKHIDSKELMDNYIPEIPTTEHFHADGQVDDEDYIYTSFLQSKMFAHGVKCTDCHNPHTTRLKRMDNQTCTKCHVPTTYDSPKHTFHPMGSKGASCISCHMPGKLFMGTDFRHDHSFRVPRPDLSVKYGTPNACTMCHTNKTDKAMADAIVKWYGPNRKYHFAEDLIPGSQINNASEAHLTKLFEDKNTPDIIKATVANYLGDIITTSSLSKLLSGLNDKSAEVRYHSLRSLASFPSQSWIEAVGPLLSDKVRAVRIAAADLYISIPKDQIASQYSEAFAKAHQELKEYLEYQTDFSVGNIMLADYYLKLDDYNNAELFYKKGLKKDSQMNYAWLNLSTVYSLQAKNELALKALLSALKNDTNNERIYYNLALLYNEMNNKPEAEKNFAKAVSLNSNNPRVYYNYGLMLNAAQKQKEAQKVLLKGIEIAPNAPELYYAIVFVYIQSNNFQKAQQAAKTLKQLDPLNANYQQIFKDLKV